MRMHGPHRGFSLLELIIAIGIMGVVTTAGMAMFFRLFDGWQANAAGAELDYTALQVFASMRSDLAQTARSEVSASPLKTQYRHVQNNSSGYSGLLANDRLELTVLTGSPPALQTVVYEVDRSRHALTRTVAKKAEGGGERAIVAEGVVHFRVECAGPDGAWRNGWAETEAPRLVRASLVVRHPERPSAELGRTVLFAVPTASEGPS